MLQAMWSKVEYLDIFRATKGTHVEVYRDSYILRKKKKNFDNFPLEWCNPKMCITNAFWDIIILFWKPFIWTLCTIHSTHILHISFHSKIGVHLKFEGCTLFNFVFHKPILKNRMHLKFEGAYIHSRTVYTSPDRFWGSTQQPIQWVPDALSPGVKRSGRDADHSARTSVEVKKMWIDTTTPHTPSWCSA
jgi:hypothetical protein